MFPPAAIAGNDMHAYVYFNAKIESGIQLKFQDGFNFVYTEKKSVATYRNYLHDFMNRWDLLIYNFF